MFKEVNLQENICNDIYILMKNSREEFCEISKEYITNIHYSWHDISYMDIEVPYEVSINGVKKINPLYDKFLGKRQYIKVGDNERYVVTDCEKIEDYTGKKIKTIKAQSAEIALNDFDFYIGEGGITRKLFKVENELDISEGVLDLVVAETGWAIDKVTDKARLEINKMNEIYYKNLYDSLQKNNVVKDTVLWEQNFTDLNPLINNILTLNINYKNVKSYIGGTLQKDENAIHQLGSFHTGIKKIKAIYSGNEDYRYAIKYEITLNDNLTVERWCDFTYLGAMGVTFTNITLGYTIGLEVEKAYTKYRSFDEGIYKIYDFLKEVEQAFGVKMVFNTRNKTISCFHFSEVGEETPLFLSYENFVKSINKKSQYDEIISKLYVESQKTSIAEENPTGLDFIVDYTYFKENNLMSDELIKAYNRYLTAIDGKQEIIVTKRIDLNTYNKQKIKLDTERKAFEDNIKGLQSIWSAYVKEKDDVNANRIAVEINAIQDKINANLRETEMCRQNINSLNEEIKIIVDSITISTASDSQGKIFNDELLDELNDITVTDTLTDDYYSTPYSLYNYAVETLSKRNKLQIEFSIDTVGLLQNIKIPKGYTFDYILRLGNYVNVDDNEIENDKVRLVAFDYSPKDFKINSLEFSNNDEDFTELNKLSNIGRSIHKNITYTNNYKTSWVAGKDVNNFVNSMLTDYLDTKAVNIRSRGGRNKYDQSEVGVFVIDALSDNEASQIYIGSGMICFTDNNWKTVQTCLDGSGLVGQAIVGKIIAGHNLLIGNENNTMVIDESGIKIEGNYLSIKGVDGTNKDFNSYITMLNKSIELGVSDSKNHTDAQVKILSDQIVAGVSDSKNHTDAQVKILSDRITSTVTDSSNADSELQSQITQTAKDIATKVSKGTEFTTEFKQTSEDFNFNIGNSNTDVKIDKNGLRVKNGALEIQDYYGTTVLKGTTNGNLLMRGNYIKIKDDLITSAGSGMTLTRSGLNFTNKNGKSMQFYIYDDESCLYLTGNNTLNEKALYVIGGVEVSAQMKSNSVYAKYGDITSLTVSEGLTVGTGAFINGSMSTKAIDSRGYAISTSGGNLNAGSGALTCGGATINGSTSCRSIDTNGYNINTYGGNISAGSSGSLTCGSLDCRSIDCTSIYTNGSSIDAGTIYSNDKYVVVANGSYSYQQVKGIAMRYGSGSDYLEVQTRDSSTYGVTAWSSDIKLKENIELIETSRPRVLNETNDKIGLEAVLNIDHYSFDYKDKPLNHADCGYIAQQLIEVNKNFAYNVKQEDGTDMYCPDPSALIPTLSLAIKEQQSEIEILKSENIELKNRLDKLESILNTILENKN